MDPSGKEWMFLVDEPVTLACSVEWHTWLAKASAGHEVHRQTPISCCWLQDQQASWTLGAQELAPYWELGVLHSLAHPVRLSLLQWGRLSAWPPTGGGVGWAWACRAGACSCRPSLTCQQ